MARFMLTQGRMRAPACLFAALLSLSFARLAGAQSAGAPSGASATETAEAAAWRERYTRARSDLVAARYDRAERELLDLAKTAPTSADATRALDLAALARESRARAARTDGPHVRTSDELSVLYTSAFIYGLGTSAWIALETKPQNLAGAALPFIVLTTASVGGVVVADNYRPFRRGVPHSIATGLYLGFGEGLILVGYERSVADRRDESPWGQETVARVLWSGATLGGIGGAALGALREPTPGRVSYVGSTSLWTGLVAGFAGAALQPAGDKRGETAFAAAAVGYNLGLASGIWVAPRIAPSVARVRFIDLGGIGGGLLGASGYVLAAGDTSNPRAGLAATSLGMAGGIVLASWLTATMPKDLPADTESPAAGATLLPMLEPTRGGFVFGAIGAL
jgi:hypothetical protein